MGSQFPCIKVVRTKLIKMSQIARIAISRSCLSGWQRPAVVISQQASRALTTTTANKDIDSAAKFIGAGATTVGVAGSGAGDNGLHTGPQSCYIRRPLSPMVWDKAGGKLVSTSGERGILTKCFWLEWSQRNLTLQGALLNF